MSPAHQPCTSTRPSPPVASNRTRASATWPWSTSLICQPIAGEALDRDQPGAAGAGRDETAAGRDAVHGRLGTGGVSGPGAGGGLLTDEPVGPGVGVPLVGRLPPAGGGAAAAAPAGSLKGSPTRPAAAKPTPTEAAANSAHTPARAHRLSMAMILPPADLTRG